MFLWIFIKRCVVAFLFATPHELQETKSLLRRTGTRMAANGTESGKLQPARGLSDANQFYTLYCGCLYRVRFDSIHRLFQRLGDFSGLAKELSAKAEAVCPVGLPGSHGSSDGRCRPAFGRYKPHYAACSSGAHLPSGKNSGSKCPNSMRCVAPPPGDNQRWALRRHQVLLALRNSCHDASPDHSCCHRLDHFSRTRPHLTDKDCSNRRDCLFRDDLTVLARFPLHYWVCGYSLLLQSRCFPGKSTPSPRYPGSPGVGSRGQGNFKERQSGKNHDHGRWRSVVVLRPDSTMPCSYINGSFANWHCCRGNLRHGGVHVC